MENYRIRLLGGFLCVVSGWSNAQGVCQEQDETVTSFTYERCLSELITSTQGDAPKRRLCTKVGQYRDLAQPAKQAAASGIIALSPVSRADTIVVE